MALEYGYVESLLGHRSWVWGLKSRNTDERLHAERAAFDSLFQGTGSGDVTKIATLVAQQQLDELFPDPFTAPVRQVMQVHDELLWEGPRELLEELKHIPEDAFMNHVELKVPLKAESKIGKSWADVH